MMNMPYKPFTLILPAVLAILITACADNEVEYYGILDHRPEGKDGMWVIDGKSFSVTEEVELDEDHGPIEAGTCVELEMEDGDVKEIESAEPEKCQAEEK
jgi:hypothetical protein